MTLMFEARIDDMAKQLQQTPVGELDAAMLLKLHQQTCRLLRLDLPQEPEK